MLQNNQSNPITPCYGSPFEYSDVQIIVRDYLKLIPREIAKFGEDNMPGTEWVRGF